MDKLGFIGMGNMAQAIVRGLHRAEAVKKENVLAFAPYQIEKVVKENEEAGMRNAFFKAVDATFLK